MQTSATKTDHYIIAIGASAGGLEAIHEFFDNTPMRDDCSFVIVQHLSPDYKSLLVDLVSRHTHMKVFEAEDNLPVRRKCIYVIPNKKFITFKRGKLKLTDKQLIDVPNNAIDVFMASLAKEKKREAVAVILSGTGSDGTKGIAEIKKEGGLVLVQDPSTSKFNGMPNSAIGSGNVDYVLPPRDMPRNILSYIADNSAMVDDINEEALSEIFQVIQAKADLDFHLYKTPTITRRIQYRMNKGHFNSVSAYIDHLKHDPEESRLLAKDFLINVTRFFRDPEAYTFLKNEVFPAMLREKDPTEPIKLWICACSTGEEAYSLAIVVDEMLQQINEPHRPVKIFATDIERANIQIASAGLYPESILADIGEDRLKRYFTAHEKGYRVIPRIRKQLVFAVHNVANDPPFIKNDLVSCRNMLIYMNPSLQKRIYSILLFSLRLKGCLFLGTTENPHSIQNHITPLSGKFKIFRKITDGRFQSYLPFVSTHSSTRESSSSASASRSERKGLWDDFRESLFSDFNFAAFHIDRNFEIVEAIGNFQHILSLPKKILRLNLLRMLPANVSTVLAAGIKEAWKDNKKKKVVNAELRHAQGTYGLNIVIKPDAPSENRPYTVIGVQYVLVSEPVTSPDGAARPEGPDESEYILALEDELNRTKESLHAAIESLETANEELQSSNEELLSSNEELQSSNEELQSLNEELHTLNTEHQMKIRELVELNDDLNNYFRSSNVGQVFLDENLFIRKFTPASSDMINVIESDIGRPITHISTNIRYSNFVKDIQAVLKSGTTIEKEVELISGKNLLMRIMPYLTAENRPLGVIVSFIDITTVTNLNNIVRGVFNASRSAILALQAVRDEHEQIVDFMILAANHAASRLVGTDQDDLRGVYVKKNKQALVLHPMLEHFVSVVDEQSVMHTDYYCERDKVWFEISAVRMVDGLVVTLTDITQKKNSEERLKRNYSELIRAKENLKLLNAELEMKVQERTQMLAASEERFRLVSRATNDAIWDWDLTNNKIWFSEAFYIKFGHQETAEWPRDAWFKMIHPEDRAAVRADISSAINARRKQWTQEYRFQKADGSYAHILDRGYIMQDEYKTPYRMVGSMLDLTELKRAEEEIARSTAQRQFLAESMPLIVWTANEEGKVDFVNKQFELYTGIKADDAMGDGWLQAVHPEDLTRLTQLWSDAIQTKNDFQLEIRLQVCDSGYHWNILRAKVMQYGEDRLVRWVITTIDIHEQRLYHERLEQKVEERTTELLKINKALETSNHDLQQFASVASHDLQEPLRKIHLYATMIQERASDGAGNHLRKILVSSSRMKSIIHNILNYSKLSADDVRFEPTNLKGIISDIVDDLEIAIKEKDAVINVAELPVVDSIAGQIRHVFQNMIGNSLKFARPDVPPVISITGEIVGTLDFDALPDQSGDYLRVSVQDNGIGFNDKFSDQIFVLFQRLHSKDVFEGTGIGLAIAKKIIEKHNGIMRATGKENEGATFTFIIPIKQTTRK